MSLSKSEKLFLKAYHYNWDDGIGGLTKIINNKYCDKGTALMLYWHAKPDFYKLFNSEDEVPSHAKASYRFMKKIEALILDNKLPELISYTPDKSLTPTDLGNIPPEMVKSSIGEVMAQELIDNNIGELQLLKACEEGNLDVVQDMINKGINIDLKINGDMPIEIAVVSNQIEVVKLLLSHGANIKKKTGPSGFTLLQWATQSGFLEIAKLLLESGLAIDVKGKWGRTALHGAVYWEESMWIEYNRDRVVRFLLENGANPNKEDSDGLTAFDMAKKVGNNEAIKIMNEFC